MGDASLSSPFTVVRLNPWPFRLLSESRSAVFADEFAALEDAYDRVSHHSADLIATAERQIAALPELSDERTELIRIRRRIRAGKIRDEVSRVDRSAGAALLEALAYRDNALARIRVEAADAADAEAEELSRWAADPLVQRATAMTSTALATSVIRLSGHSSFDKTDRRSLPAFIRYHARSIARVSPFAEYTAVGAVFGQSASGGDDLRLRSVVESSRLVYRLLFRLLVADPTIGRHLPWQVSELIELRDDQMLVHRRAPRGTASSRFEGAAERTAAIPTASPWAALIDALTLTVQRPTSFDNLVARIAAASESSEERAASVADRLVELGAIVPVLPVSEHSPNFDEEWAEFLHRMLGPQHPLARLHDDTARIRSKLPTLHGRARVDALNQMHQRWSDAVREVNASEPITNDLYLEDSYVSGSFDGYQKARVAWEADIKRLRPLLRASDNHDVFAAVVDNAFVEAFGAEGTCDNLIQFSELVAARIERTIRGAEGVPNVQVFESELNAPERERRSVARRLLREWAKQPGPEFEIPEADLDALCRKEQPSARRSTLAVHGHPDGDRFIVNHFYGGPGVYLSRFTHVLTPHQRQTFERYVASANSADQSMQLRPVFGFNANLAPVLAQTVLGTPNEPHAHTGTRRSIGDLSARREHGILILHDRVSGHDTELRYYGFLVPFVLPSLERMLTAYWGGPAISLDVLDEEIADRLHRSEAELVSSPRLRFRSLVIARRRWAVRTSTLLGLLAADADSIFINFNLWRRRNDIPAQAFLKPVGGGPEQPSENFRAPKPTLVDFDSVLHVATLRKLLERFPVAVMLEEVDPSPASAGLTTPAGRHAMELYFETPYTNENA